MRALGLSVPDPAHPRRSALPHLRFHYPCDRLPLWAGNRLLRRGYIGTIVWALLSGNFIALHSPLTDGITVGLSAALPALIHLKGGKVDLMSLLEKGKKGKFIGVSLFWSILFGVLMILATSLSLSYFAGLDYWFCVVWIGIADVVPIALTPFVVMWLAPLMKNVRTLVPYV